ncbi:YggT family protein [Phyllobacterium myrsinacearum]|uniref:YggT family protein n=2 Tax=Phyllobacterium myrsinacearum TaxID=28101 RepID=A0A839EDJ9_9HYPH|nr:YggT family protein [Phyllobacterium myrsinacearum]
MSKAFGRRILGWEVKKGAAVLKPANLLPLARRPANRYMSRDYQEKPMLALIRTIDLALDIYTWILIASAIFSWLYAFNVINSSNRFVASIGDFLYRVTEPALRPIRRFLPDLGGIDISPIVLLLIIFFLRQFLWTTIAPLLV